MIPTKMLKNGCNLKITIVSCSISGTVMQLVHIMFEVLLSAIYFIIHLS